ncbi:amidophosphoribosyltransferase [candidate division GN15 bacterium]|uniref:Amidophosphoribosyltransferase n=1 Tax=candidate division GN15 bacterium TaxID=2072418 RepID=A0A855X3P9_9BACT|nr:MAG: amidophosphoribosyltransferase [candidate division GN15 bacterium]
MSEDMIHDQCGVFGILGNRDASRLTYLGLYALQHRGQESAGIVTSEGSQVHLHKGMGQVADVFDNQEILERLKGDIAIGHTRYSTTGASSIINIQPFLITNRDKYLAIGHNGNLTNSLELRKKLDAQGSIFQTTSDTEIILHLVATSKKSSHLERICDALNTIKGAFSLLFLTENSIIAARDSRGFRPLALGKFDGAWVVASETCAFDLIGAKYIRDVEPGEVIEITRRGLKSIFPMKKAQPACCIFEYIYFARPDSKIFGDNVDKVRRRLGRQLAKEHPVDADIVIGIPDSANTATLGFAEESGIPFEIGLIRNHYVGRTFIDPHQEIRDLDVRVKFNPVKGVLKDKRVVVVDDSIVRGTTSKKLVQMIREAGAKEVHFRVSSPPIISPCFFGIDMPTRKELIAANMSVKQIEKYLGVDSLRYLSIKGMLSMPSLPDTSFCASCFSGKYPMKVPHVNGNKMKLGVVPA